MRINDLLDTIEKMERDDLAIILAAVAARLAAAPKSEPGTPTPEMLLDAAQMAHRLNLPESFVRSEARAGRLPSVKLGKYMRFDPREVERTYRRSYTD